MDVDGVIWKLDMVFILVNILMKIFGIGSGCVVNFEFVEWCVWKIVEVLMGYKIVVEKLIFFVCMVEVVKWIFLYFDCSVLFDVLSNLEFFVEGMVIDDLFDFDWVLIGGELE